LIDEATINTTFITDKSAAQPTASDVFLFCQPGTPIYRKVTYSTMLLSATNLITSQGEQDVPATNDFILIFDTSAGTLAKTPLQSLFTNAWWIAGLPDYTNWPFGGFSYPFVSNGVPFRVEHSNLFAGWWQWQAFDTNAANNLTNTVLASFHTTPTNNDLLLIHDRLNNTNKFTTLVGLVTNLPSARPGLTNGDIFVFLQTRTNSVNPFGTNAVLSKMTFADLLTNVYAIPTTAGSFDSTSRVSGADSFLVFSRSTNASPDATNFPASVQMSNIVQRFVTSNIPLVAGASAQGLHLLGGRPQIVKWYLVCTNSGDASGYANGDKIPLEYAVNAAGGTAAGAGGANFTQVFCKLRTATPTIPDKTGTGVSAITAANWNLECEAEFWPFYR
jgi:hypothetical protein